MSISLMQVHTLSNPSEDEFCRALDLYRPTLVYLQGDQFKDRIGSHVLGGRDYGTAEAMAGLFSSTLPVMVCDLIAKLLCTCSLENCRWY